MKSQRTIIPFIIRIFKKSNISLFERLAMSLERDKELPLLTIIGKSLVFFISLLRGKIYFRECEITGHSLRARKKPNIENAGRIEIGDYFNLNSRNVQSDLVTGPDGVIKIGNNVSINFGASIVARNLVQLGNRVRCGPYTMIYDSNMHVHGKRFVRASGEPVIIEDDAWLASRVTVLKGAVIGEGAVVSSGSVVTGIIPPYTVAGGVPAKVIKYLETDDHRELPRLANEHTNYTSNIIKHRVMEVFNRVFKNKTNNGNRNVFFKKGRWNSEDHLKLICELENEFDITISNKDVVRMTNINKICKILSLRYLKQKKVIAKQF